MSEPLLTPRQAQVIRYKYGLTAEDWQEMYDRQNGRCAICGKHQRYRALSVDHDHKMKGKESCRGLLCVRCNYALGRFYDDPILLRCALEYLEAFAARVGKIKEDE